MTLHFPFPLDWGCVVELARAGFRAVCVCFSSSLVWGLFVFLSVPVSGLAAYFLSVPSSLGMGRSPAWKRCLIPRVFAFSPLFIGDGSFTPRLRVYLLALLRFQSPLHWGWVVH